MRLRWWDGTAWSKRTRERTLEDLLATPPKTGPLSNADVLPVAWIKVREDGALEVSAHDNRFSRLGLVLGVGATLIFPLFLGLGGVVFGARGWRRGERWAPAVVALAIAGAAVGVLLASYVAPVVHHH
jgi:hypothetical protein